MSYELEGAASLAGRIALKLAAFWQEAQVQVSLLLTGVRLDVRVLGKLG